MTSSSHRYIRLRDLQILLWARKHHRALARRIGAQLKQMREDHHHLRDLY